VRSGRGIARWLADRVSGARSSPGAATWSLRRARGRSPARRAFVRGCGRAPPRSVRIRVFVIPGRGLSFSLRSFLGSLHSQNRRALGPCAGGGQARGQFVRELGDSDLREQAVRAPSNGSWVASHDSADVPWDRESRQRLLPRPSDTLSPARGEGRGAGARFTERRWEPRTGRLAPGRLAALYRFAPGRLAATKFPVGLTPVFRVNSGRQVLRDTI
jgi:hypothetical protein